MTAWKPWRARSPLGGEPPTREQMQAAIDSGYGREDVLPFPTDSASAGHVRLLVIGINPSPWTAAVNAPFARPGNRFWPSLAEAGILPHVVDASRGLSTADEELLALRGIAVTNIVARPTARAGELAPAELRAGAARIVERVNILKPGVVAILGITAFRAAFSLPEPVVGRQAPDSIEGWPADVPLRALPNPSGLNAHETTQTLAAKWREVWRAANAGDPAG